MKANLLVWLTLASSSFAIAQTSTTFKEQFKLIKAPNAIASVGVDLFGDKVNLYSGSVEFVQNDVSLPGNSRLPVSIGRRLAVGQFAFDDRAFGKWSLEIPHLHGVFARSSSSALPGWVGDDGSNLRCSKFGAPAEAVGLQGSSKWHPREFWRGNYLYVPGAGDQQMLRRAPDYTRTPSPVRLDGVDVKAFSIVTGSHLAIGCLPSLKNYPTLGEGFLVISPEGTKYKFDWLVTYKASTLTKSWVGPSPNMASEADNSDVDATPDSIELDEDDLSDVVTSPTLPRTEVWILPTKIVDRFGNTVTYTYDPENPANLTKIEANDGRTIKLTYVR